MQDKFFITVEVQEKYRKLMKEFELYTDYGKSPSIGDYVRVLGDAGYKVDIKDFGSMIFKPVSPNDKPELISLRVIRALKDTSHAMRQIRKSSIYT
ncbi:hypothetical protein [Paenibacillus turpanensis]|uniref:hypothetical protein n=1 Tax=Paenibacillus turpanensis TaxID=2689078 RepID=UPI00140AE112|nr:hypothetical protein [Paenibacillus turpanensis]